MADPHDTPHKAPADDLDARVAALEQYLNTPQSASPESIEIAGGTIIHVPPFGSFYITSNTASRAGISALAGLLVFGMLLLILRHRRPRHEPK